MSTQDEIIQVRNSLTKNRTEHFGKDVWLEFVRPKFLENIDLTSDMPTRLEGGRGCGKTMLLRYLSFYSQFSTQRENISDDAIKKIGIYWKADTQFLRLMQKRQVEESEWISIFDHYLILSLVVEVLNSVVAVAKSSYPQFFGKDVEAIAFSGIKDYGYRSEDFHEVISETCSRLRKTESFVQNINKENVIEKVPPSFLAFVIDSIKKSKVFALSKFYVYVDEYENLLNYQQRVINTKIKHSEPPLVFNIAIKVNGMSEALTLSDESLENKADYSVVNLDKEIEKSGFSDFVAEILIKKFTIAAPSVLSAIGSAKSHIDFSLTEADRKIIVDKIFPGRSHQDLADEIFETVVYKKKLLSEIEAALNFRSEKVLMANDFVHESFRKASIICSSILYRQSLAVTDIHNELLSLVNGKENRFTNSTAWEHNNFLGCYLRIAKSFKANSSFYSGFDVYVALSGGNVRHFLELCKTAFSFSELDKTLNSIVIGRPIQHLAARSTSEELFTEIQRFTPLGFQLNNFVKGLGKIFQLCQDRFSQSEPEVTHFSIRGDHSNLDSEDIKFIQEAEKWSVLLPTENTKSKSPNFLPFDYVLNPIYAPFFFISYRKGRKIEIEVSDFKSLYSNGIMGISAPLKKRLRISDVEIADDLPSQGAAVMIDVKAAFHDADYVLPKSFDLGIFGSSIDDRTQYSIQYVEKYTNSSIELIYDKEQLNLVVNGDSIECHNFPIYLKEKNISSLILDSTSLDVPELALVIKAIASIPKLEVLILYVEPENYSGNSPIFEQETFTLSDSIIGFEGDGIPTISLPVDSHSPRKFVFFLGFEGTRLLNAIETYDVSEDEAKIVFGVPAFQSGWESKSIRSNMPTLKEYKFKGRISYCSASSPKSALAILREAGSSESCEHIYVVPIGTKPNTVGALLYILEKPEGIRLLYDQPKKKVGRSSGVGAQALLYVYDIAMKFHPTPSFIVEIIRKHVPKTARTVLEPAVGEGALLSTFEKRNYQYTLIDIDKSRLDALSTRLKSHSLIHADFIAWSQKNISQRFDLVLTNPPFSAKAESWIDFEGEYVPIEIAFIMQARKLLKAGGTLIAIVPDSIINSSRFLKFRTILLENSMINYVYQLPQKIFSKIEGGFYLIILTACGSTKKISLRDASSNRGKEIVVTVGKLRENMHRLDYRYYRGYQQIAEIINNIRAQVSSLDLNSFCRIVRGSIRSNYHEESLHHSNSFVNGFWRGFTVKDIRYIEECCIVVKRVARDAHQSFGLIDKSNIYYLTDCLILIEQNGLSPLKLLFFLRVIYANEYGKEYLLKGSGAKFIAVEGVRDFSFFDISTIFPDEFKLFSKAYLNRDISKCLQVENYVFNILASRGRVLSIKPELKESCLSPLRLLASLS